VLKVFEVDQHDERRRLIQLIPNPAPANNPAERDISPRARIFEHDHVWASDSFNQQPASAFRAAGSWNFA
jgi:hypothetical protein